MSYVEIRNGIYHVGDPTTYNGLDCNPYLLIDGDEAILFDPGSPLDFQCVLENVKALISLDRVKTMVLHHPDPDFCTAVPLLENEGLQAKIVTTWRSMTLIQYYDIKSPYYVLEENQMQLSLRSGRKLTFIPTPYLHFAGSFVTYDETSKCLFSSDLFGAFSYNRTLFADEHYMDKMLSFHENYMPSNAILRPVMEVLSLYDIQVILPQHGSIIDDRVPDYIDALRTLECGSLLAPVKKNLMQSGGYTMIFNEIYKRISSLYPLEQVNAVFRAIEALEFNEKDEITGYHLSGETVWNMLFSEIKSKMGMVSLSLLEPFVRNLSAVYDLQLPAVFSDALTEVMAENLRLQEINLSLDQAIKSTNNRMLKCHITGLYNEAFFRSLLVEELEHEDLRDMGALVCIGIDDFSTYHLRNGNQEERVVLNNMAYLLKEAFGSNAVYRMDFTEFALYIKGKSKQELIEKLDRFRVDVSRSDYFLGSVTVSAGLAFPDEIELDASSNEIIADKYIELALNRLRIVQVSGKNKICYEGEEDQRSSLQGKVLIVDTDTTNIALLKTFLEEEGIEVLSADNGIDAKNLAFLHRPKIIVSEIMLYKMDGFILRTELLNNSKTKDIETVFMSHRKDDEYIERAISLGVTHYIHKPYLLSELLGIIKYHVRGMGA